MTADGHLVGHITQRGCHFRNQSRSLALHAHTATGEHREVGVVDDFNTQAIFVAADRHFVFQAFELFVFRKLLFELLFELFKVFFVFLFRGGFAVGFAHFFRVATAFALSAGT